MTEEVLKVAAGNQAHREQIITILLDQLKDEVRGSISEEVINAAAGNRQYGAQIMEKLLKVCGDVICQKLSFAGISTGAQNRQSGALILDLLLEADEEKVLKLVPEAHNQAVARIGHEGRYDMWSDTDD